MDVTYFNPFIKAMEITFKKMLNEVLIIEKPIIKKEKIHSFDISGMVTISGDVNGIISISFPKRIALRIGSVIFGEQIKIVGTELTDSIVNLVKIITEEAKQHCINCKIQFSIPYVVAGKDRPIEIDPSIPLIIVPFKCGQGKLALEIAATSKKSLPQDPEKLRNYSWELCLSYQRLSEKYNKLLRKMYGRSTEKQKHVDTEELDAIQMEMDELLEEALAVKEDAPSTDEEEETIEVTTHRRRRRKSGRNSIPEELITEEILDIPDSEKKCNCCGREMTVFDKKPHLVVERGPAQYKATRYIRPVYGCSHCKDTTHVAEPVHLPIAKGLAGPLLLTFVILSKYQYHLPLYRIQPQIFHESRIWFTRSTLVSWLRHICDFLDRIHQGLLSAYRASRIKHADDTPFQVKRDKKYQKAYMWVGITGDSRIAVFQYNRHRSGQAALQLLEGSQPGDYLMIDDCPSFNKPIKKLKLIDLRCLIHIRRKILEAFKSGHKKEFNKKILIKIGQLYRIERFADKHEFSFEQRFELRQRLSRSIMDQIKAHLCNPGFLITPKSATGVAIKHFLKNWEQATRFLDAGDLPIDNSINLSS